MVMTIISHQISRTETRERDTTFIFYELYKKYRIPEVGFEVRHKTFSGTDM